MAPIKVGFIGLSTKGWAKGAHLPYLKASPEYEVVAVCNSSVESAEKAIEVFELSGAKGYGDPESLCFSLPFAFYILSCLGIGSWGMGF